MKCMIADYDPRVRGRAAWVLGEIGATGFYRPLVDLLRDPDVRVQATAIESCARLKSPKLIEPLLSPKQEVMFTCVPVATTAVPPLQEPEGWKPVAALPSVSAVIHGVDVALPKISPAKGRHS